ncbi:MAG: rane protein [Polaromonas sp.]|nr:rane protein [Polaromonas sp.]
MNKKAPMNESAAADQALNAEDARVDHIVSQGPSGTFAVAGVATAIVVAIYFAFYFFAYLPRGAVQ